MPFLSVYEYHLVFMTAILHETYHIYFCSDNDIIVSHSIISYFVGGDGVLYGVIGDFRCR